MVSEQAVRLPSGAGIFYPADRAGLRRLLDALVSAGTAAEGQKESALAILVPHAGLMYSGGVAAAVYRKVRIPDTAVILGFHHRGYGAPFAAWPGSAWVTPLGRIEIRSDLTRFLRRAFPQLEDNRRAYEDELSVEMQLPFLQYFNPNVKIVPVALNSWRDSSGFDDLCRFGRALARVLEGQAPEALVIASSDLNHYEREDTTYAKDRLAIEAMEKLDARRLLEVVSRENISMCGFAPAVAAITYARARGGTRAVLLAHATSGDVTGDRERIIGYAGMLFE